MRIQLSKCILNCHVKPAHRCVGTRKNGALRIMRARFHVTARGFSRETPICDTSEHASTNMRYIRYITIVSALAVVTTVLAVLALQQNVGSAQNVAAQQGITMGLNQTASINQQPINCTQYGEFQGEFQCGPQVNLTKYNATGNIPYQLEDEVEYESQIED